MNESHSDQFVDYDETIRQILSNTKTPTLQRDFSVTKTVEEFGQKEADESMRKSASNPFVVNGPHKLEPVDNCLTSSMLDSTSSMIYQTRQSPVVEILSQARVEIEKNRQEIGVLRTSLRMKEKQISALRDELDTSRQVSASMVDQLKAHIQASSNGDLRMTNLMTYSFGLQVDGVTAQEVTLQTDAINEEIKAEDHIKILAKLEQTQREYESLKAEHECFQLKLASAKNETEFTSFKALLEYNQLKVTHANTLTQIKAIEMENSLMDQQIQELTSQIEALKGENKKLLSKISLLESESSSMQVKFDSMQEQSNKLCLESKRVETLFKDKIGNCLEEMAELRAENSSLSDRINEYVNAYKSKSEELSTVTKERDSLLRMEKEANEKLREQCKELEQKIVSQQMAHTSESENANLALTEVKAQNEVLEKKLQVARQTLDQTSEAMKMLTSENATLRESMEKSNASIAARMDAAIAANRASFELRITQLERELEDARSEASVAGMKLHTQKELVTQDQREIDSFKISLKTAENTISTLQQALAAYSKDGNLKQRFDSVTEQNNQLTEKVQELELELSKRKAKEHTLSKDLEFLKENADTLAKKCERRGLAKMELQSALKERDAQLAQNVQEITKLRTELSSQIATLEVNARRDAESLQRVRLEKEELIAQLVESQQEASKLKIELSKRNLEVEQMQISTTKAIDSISVENKSLLQRLEQTTNEASQLRLTNQQITTETMKFKQETEQIRQENIDLHAEIKELRAKNVKKEAQTNADIDALSARIEEMVNERQTYEKERQNLLMLLADKESSLDAAQLALSSQLNFKKVADSLATENSTLRLELEQMRLSSEQIVMETGKQNEELIRKNKIIQSTLSEKTNTLEMTVGLLKEGKETVQQLQQEKDLLLQKVTEQQGLLSALQSKINAKEVEHASQILQLELQTQEYAAELRQLTDLHNNYRKSIEVGDTMVAEKLNALAEINREMLRSSHSKTPRIRSFVGSTGKGSTTNTQFLSSIGSGLDHSRLRAYNFLDKARTISSSIENERNENLGNMDEEVMRLTTLREELQRSTQSCKKRL